MFKKCFIVLFTILLSTSLFGQFSTSFDIVDNTKKVACYADDKEAKIDFYVTDSSTCAGNCLYFWQDGETETSADFIISKTGKNVSFKYTSDGEFKPSLVVFDMSHLHDSVKQSTFTKINSAFLKDNTVHIPVTYNATTGSYLDTLSFPFSSIDTAISNVSVRIYSPKSGVPHYEITTSKDAKAEFYPYPNQTYLHTFTPNKDFQPLEKNKWIYDWDFDHETPAGSNEDEKDSKTVNTTSDTVDHLFPYENLKGYEVKLTITLDILAFSTTYVRTHNLSGCSSTTSTNVIVTDGFYGSTGDKVELSERVPRLPNVFTPNGDDINEVFTFAVSGQDFYSIKIYNRWGNLVFEQEGYTINWEGKTNSGGICPTGTYYYVLTSNRDDERHNTQGFVQLFRE